jgi:dihydrofolate reductase
MKVILYTVMTINGFIAKENDDTSFVSETALESFDAIIKRTGNMIIGRRTYEVMKKNNEFDEVEVLKDTRVIIVADTNTPSILSKNHSIATSPKQALETLEREGFSEVLVAGGGMLNGSFMAENLIDEIYINVEPVVFGKGIRLFGEKDFETKLELVETKKLSENEIHLHYRVLKEEK